MSNEIEYETIEITTEFIRLDSFLKFTGIAETGGHAKIIVEDELAFVDGELCTQRGRKLYPGMTVTLDGLEEVFRVVATGEAPEGKESPEKPTEEPPIEEGAQ